MSAIPVVSLSPSGRVYLLPDASRLIPERISRTFDLGCERGLLHLGLFELEADLPPDLSYWRDLGRLFFSKLCALPGLADLGPDDGDKIKLPPPHEELEKLAQSAPPMTGAEYLNADALARIWSALLPVFLREEVGETSKSIQTFFETRGVAWNLVGRVCFHLAENKAHPETPFAFLATYSHRLSSQGKSQHLPLGRALQEYAGEKNKEKLLQLLLPVQKSAEQSDFLKAMIDSGEIFQPLAMTPHEAFRFLKDVPLFESAGVIVRVPDWWKAKRPTRPQVSVKIGGTKATTLGMTALLDFSVSLTLEGETLTEKELRTILSGSDGLALIRGKWVEIDREKLKEVLDHWKSVEREVGSEGITFIEGMRLLSGARIGSDDVLLTSDAHGDWAQITAGEWLSQQLSTLREPSGKLKEETQIQNLRATLRPYQQTGVEWLWFLNRLGLGGCLADDMGLGKTIQVISLMLLLKEAGGVPGKKNERSLLVVPASLIGNWKSELERFSPGLRFWIAHPSESKPGHKAENPSPEALDLTDLVITTYGFLGRLPWLTDTQWNLVVIDEAQAIKNPASKQTRFVKALQSRQRIALTGTPVENHLSDLWSLYDFICPGLLGKTKEFEAYVKAAQKSESPERYASLRNLVRPYLLRRLKTDKSIISDLPEKTEFSAYCSLTKTQAALYQQAVEDLATRIESIEGIQRRGVVLAALMRFKQICNHPSQWLSDGRYDPKESGKFGRLREICEEIASKQEKVLVFTQFKEMTEPLYRTLTKIFGRPGLVLHGETAVKKRKELVDVFQEEQGPPFFVLSLKAGGTGLNLTAASHVIHFDRWWNPAVENQATDRAFRIGQKKNVLVHKLICRGTVEEKIDALISAKLTLSQEILEGSQEALLTELSNEELMKLVTLDMKRAIEEG